MITIEYRYGRVATAASLADAFRLIRARLPRGRGLRPRRLSCGRRERADAHQAQEPDAHIAVWRSAEVVTGMTNPAR